MKENEIKRLEVVQSKCLRQLIGAKAHSTTDGMEVITNVPPFRLRTWDLCMREYIRIKGSQPQIEIYDEKLDANGTNLESLCIPDTT